MRHLLLLSLLFMITFGSYAQNDTLTYAKGRVITSLYGAISNQKLKLTTGEIYKYAGYTLGTKSGVFIKNNWVLGLNFSLTKTEFSNININTNDEDFVLGLWSRLYFAQKGSVALYAEITPYFTSVNRLSTIQDEGTIIVNEEVSGNGFGILPGFGFVYILNRNVGFGMTLSYPFGKINIDTKDLLLDNTISSSYNATELQFSFNFQIYLDQFFF